MEKNEKFEQQVLKPMRAGTSGMHRAMLYLADGDKVRRLGAIERYAIAKLAYNATAQYAKMAGRSTRPWDEVYDQRPDGWEGVVLSKAGLADTVAMIECRVRGIPVQIQDLFSTDPGDWDFFLAVVDGAVKLETGWKPKPPPPPRSAWDRVYEAIELLLLDVCEREASLAMKQPAKLTVVVPEHLWCQAHQATERIVLAGSPQQADGKVQIAITKIWSNAAPDREVIVDLEAGKKLHGDCVVIRRASGHTYVRVVPAVDSVPDPRWLKLHENDKKRWLHENDKAGETA
jgi:hypothetical protein